MREELLRIRKDRRDISIVAGRISHLLNATGIKDAPSRYQSVLRETGALRTLWVNHCRFLSALFPFEDLPDQLLAENVAITGMLDRLVTSRWPRSAHIGLISIRSRTAEILASVARQLEREESLLRTISQRRHVVSHVDSESSERHELLSI